MKQARFEVVNNDALTADVYRLVLKGDTSAITAPGQFVEIAIPGKFLRRPISVCDVTGDMLTMIIKKVGIGTEQLSTVKTGDMLDLLCGLGNGFDTSVSGESPVLIGGGVGIPPMFGLCRKLLKEGKHPSVILGFNKESEIFYADAFEALIPGRVHIATADGSVGTRGFVTDVLKTMTDTTYFYTCGPLPMYRAIEKTAKTPGQYSFEQRMGCGFGACMGCSMKTANGPKRVCKEGPVFLRDEILWEEL